MDNLSSISTGLDLTKVPSIHQKRLLTFVNHFLITTVRFLNNFAQTCEKRLMTCSQKIQKLEAELCILEAKFNSIPGLEDEEEVTKPEQKPEEGTTAGETGAAAETGGAAETSAPEVDTETTKPSEAGHVAESEAGETASATTPSPETNPELARYLKMVHFGVPIAAVKLKMAQDGFDPNLLGS